MNHRLIAALQAAFLGLFLLLSCGQGLAQVSKGARPKNHPFVVAFKTNLLYDAACLANIEVEMGFGPHWSLMAEGTGIEMISEDKGKSTVIGEWGLEGRYWFCNDYSDRGRRAIAPDPLHGFFCGAYCSFGGYDLERNYRGCQDRHCWSSGLSFGYSFHLTRAFRLELSTAVGYMHSQYRHYHQKELPTGTPCYVEHYRSDLDWIGPTKAKASIVWIPQLHKKGARR